MIDIKREEFEIAASRLGYNLTMAEYETGEYHYPVTQDAWDLWQEAIDAARHPPAKVPNGFEDTFRSVLSRWQVFAVGDPELINKSDMALFRKAEDMLNSLTTPTPATTPETEWVKCPSCGDFAYECDVCGGKPE